MKLRSQELLDTWRMLLLVTVTLLAEIRTRVSRHSKVQDYSWEEHGFSLINRLYPDIGQLLDDKFSCAINLNLSHVSSLPSNAVSYLCMC